MRICAAAELCSNSSGGRAWSDSGVFTARMQTTVDGYGKRAIGAVGDGATCGREGGGTMREEGAGKKERELAAARQRPAGPLLPVVVVCALKRKVPGRRMGRDWSISIVSLRLLGGRPHSRALRGKVGPGATLVALQAGPCLTSKKAAVSGAQDVSGGQLPPLHQWKGTTVLLAL